MKKLTIILLALCLSLLVFACKGQDDKNASSSSTSSAPGISIEPTKAPEPTATPVPETIAVVKITGEGVNVRSSSNTDSDNILGQAEKDEYYALVKEGKEWHQITYNNKEAYISASFAAVEQANPSVLKGEPSTETSGTEGSSSENSGTDDADQTSSATTESSAIINAEDIRAEEDGQAGR